jgi:phosphorylcholine metabolism protein LicD
MDFINNNFFSTERGFGKHRDTAIKLLNQTIYILNKYNIDYFLISGTLLGCMRHNDFIPWDDDIDLLIDSTFREKFHEIYEKI